MHRLTCSLGSRLAGTSPSRSDTAGVGHTLHTHYCCSGWIRWFLKVSLIWPEELQYWLSTPTCMHRWEDRHGLGLYIKHTRTTPSQQAVLAGKAARRNLMLVLLDKLA